MAFPRRHGLEMDDIVSVHAGPVLHPDAIRVTVKKYLYDVAGAVSIPKEGEDSGAQRQENAGGGEIKSFPLENENHSKV